MKYYFKKVIITTETFSLGAKMPTRTVVFTSIEKFDGNNYRWIRGSEYIQMNSCRGLDKRGTCIIIADKRINTSAARDILKGVSDLLGSSFYLTYNILLNMQKTKKINPIYLIKWSFLQLQRDQKLSGKRRVLKLNIEKFKKLTKKDNFTEKQYKAYLVPGRLIHVSDKFTD